MKTNQLKAIITPPAFLQGRAREIWAEILPEVKTQGIASQAEAHGLACLCTSIADLEAAELAIAEHGLVHKTERGITKNPAISIKNAALQNIYKFSTAFGLTPASRGKSSFARRQNLNK